MEFSSTLPATTLSQATTHQTTMVESTSTLPTATPSPTTPSAGTGTGSETIQLTFLLKSLSNFFFWLADVVTIKNISIWHSKALYSMNASPYGQNRYIWRDLYLRHPEELSSGRNHLYLPVFVFCGLFRHITAHRE